MNHKSYLLSALVTGAALASSASAQVPTSPKNQSSVENEEFVNYRTHSGRVSRYRDLHKSFQGIESDLKIKHEGQQVGFPVFTLPKELQEKYSNLIDFDDKPAVLINAPERIFYVDTNADVLINLFKQLKAFVLNEPGKTKILDMNDVRLNEITKTLLETKDSKVFVASKSSWGIIKIGDERYTISEDDIPKFKSNLDWDKHQEIESILGRSYNRDGIGMELQAFGPKELNFFADWAFITGSRFKSALFFKDQDSNKVKFVALDKILALSSDMSLDETKSNAKTVLDSILAKITKD